MSKAREIWCRSLLLLGGLVICLGLIFAIAKPDRQMIGQLPKFAGRIFSGEKLSPDTFTISHGLE